MTEIYHLNCVKIVSPFNDNVCGHCLLLKEKDRLILIDTGIGLSDTMNPVERIGQELIDIVGYDFDENLTAVRQIQKMGLDPGNVSDCIISHLDNDHIGGLADFPNATVHVGIEEFENFNSGNPRYLKTPLSHMPSIITYGQTDVNWFGFDARRLNAGLEAEVYLVPLFGHTSGHCGVALQVQHKWLFYVADAYYMRAELNDSRHPVNELASMRADNNDLRIATVDKIRKFVNDYPEIEVFGYHDIEEFRHFEKEDHQDLN